MLFYNLRIGLVESISYVGLCRVLLVINALFKLSFEPKEPIILYCDSTSVTGVVIKSLFSDIYRVSNVEITIEIDYKK